MLLRAKGRKGLGVGCGEGGGEYGCITGRDRRDGSRPAGCEIVVEVARQWLLRGHADGTGDNPSGSRGEGLLEVPILGHGDLDRLRHDVCPVGAAAEVLRVVVDRSDEIGGRGGALEDLTDAINIICHRHYGPKRGTALVELLSRVVRGTLSV